MHKGCGPALSSARTAAVWFVVGHAYSNIQHHVRDVDILFKRKLWLRSCKEQMYLTCWGVDFAWGQLMFSDVGTDVYALQLCQLVARLLYTTVEAAGCRLLLLNGSQYGLSVEGQVKSIA